MLTAAKATGWRIVLAAGLAWWVEKFVTVEWSYPYCNVRDDGPAGAVFGFPFPYDQASIVTSATHFFIAWLYLINLCAIALAFYLVLKPVRPLLDPRKGIKFLVSISGAVLLATAIAFDVMVLSMMDVWRPVRSFSGSPEYAQLRPVAVRTFRRQADCTASPFWFGSRRRP